MLKRNLLAGVSALMLALMPTPSTAQTVAVTPEVVSSVQDALNNLGYAAGPVDGLIGNRTRNAISAYQTDVGLPVTGEIDAALLESLESPGRGVDNASLVLEIEKRLDSLGYAVGEIDGTIDHQLGIALSKYTRFAGVPVRHEPTLATLAHIERHDLRNDSDRASKLIWNVETELTRRGYLTGLIDGTLDQYTVGAIRDYEDDAGLPLNGKVDATLLDSLEIPDPRTVTPEDIGEIERRLDRRGYTVGAVDGVADAQTASAIEAYQADAGLTVTGSPSVILLDDLRSSIRISSNDGSP